jgi:formylmethanofuran dehydrogenase subunit E
MGTNRNTREILSTIRTMMPIDELFITREVKPEIPVRAKIFTSVQCASCGETVAEHRARVRNGKFLCMPCAGEYGRGW